MRSITRILSLLSLSVTLGTQILTLLGLPEDGNNVTLD